jgi:predicted DNA-binding transcriptional regulator AlpA
MNIENEIFEIKDLLKQVLSTSKEIMNVQEVSIYTGIPVATIYAKMDTIPRSKQGKRLFFLKKDIDLWLMANRRKTSAEIEMEASTYVMKRKFG